MNEYAEMLKKLVVSESSQKYSSYYDFTLTMTFLIFSVLHHLIFLWSYISLCNKNAHKIEFPLSINILYFH